MTTIRMLGAAMIALSGVLGAYFLNAAAREKLTQTESFIRLTRFLRSEIECYSMPLPKAIGRCPTDIVNGCGYVKKTPPEGMTEFVRECRVGDLATKRIAEGLAREIGRGYREEQVALCDYYVSRFEERRAALSAQLPIKRKMNSALCISGALAVVVLLI